MDLSRCRRFSTSGFFAREWVRERDLKMCEKCGSTNESELDSEICIHFSGRENLSNPALFVFPKLSVCLECGRSQFTLAKTELEKLRREVSQASATVRKWRRSGEPK